VTARVEGDDGDGEGDGEHESDDGGDGEGGGSGVLDGAVLRLTRCIPERRILLPLLPAKLMECRAGEKWRAGWRGASAESARAKEACGLANDR